MNLAFFRGIEDLAEVRCFSREISFARKWLLVYWGIFLVGHEDHFLAGVVSAEELWVC